MSGGARSGLRGAARGLVILMLGLSGGCMIALAPDIAMPLVVLMLPGLVALLIDSRPGLTLARAMLLFQAAACADPVADAWFRCAGIHGCLDYLSAPLTVARAWTAGAAAFVLAQVMPIVLKIVEDYRLRDKRSRLEERRKELVADWGLEDKR
jgi:hypothetical protein